MKRLSTNFILRLFVHAVPIMLCLISFAALIMPVVSGYAVGELVSAEMMVRGYNLPEFSGYGLAVFAVPLLLLNVQCMRCAPKQRVVAAISIGVLFAVCFAVSLQSAGLWLADLPSNEPISLWNLQYYGGRWVMPCAVLVQVLWGVFLGQKANSPRKMEGFRTKRVNI